MERLGRVILRHRRALAVALGLLIALASLGIPRLRFDFSITPLIEGTPQMERELRAFQERHPPRAVSLVCTLSWPAPIGAEELRLLSEREKRLRALPLVESTSSLASQVVVDASGMLPLPRIFSRLVKAEHSALEVARDHPLVLGTLLSHDGKSASIAIKRDREKTQGEAKREFLKQVEGEIARWKSGPRVRLLGNDLVERQMGLQMKEDFTRTLQFELLLFVILLPLLFRSLRGIAVPLVVVVGASALCMGLSGWADAPISLLDLAVPALIMIIGVSDAVHMLHRFEEEFAERKDRDASILAMLRSVGWACFHTSSTTALGFLSLLSADHTIVRVMGVKAAIAVTLTYLLVLFGMPLGLSLWPVRKAAPQLASWTRLSYRRSRWPLVIGAFAIVLGVWGSTRVKVDSRWLEELDPGSGLVQELRWFEAHFRGLLSLELQVEGKLEDPRLFDAVEKLQLAMLAEPGVNGAEGYTHWVREAVGRPRGALTERQILRGMKALRLVETDHLIDADQRSARVVLPTGDIGTQRFDELAARAEALLDELPGGAVGRVTGVDRHAHRGSRRLVYTLARSFLISLVAIGLVMSWLFSSLRLALVASLPNVLPLLLALGLAGWMGIPLRIGIAMIFCVGLGLAVDDTIHVVTRYLQERKQKKAQAEALRATIEGTGRALVTTSIILTLGSASYLPSGFRSLHDVGVLMSVIAVVAMLADLFLLPRLIEALVPRC